MEGNCTQSSRFTILRCLQFGCQRIQVYQETWGRLCPIMTSFQIVSLSYQQPCIRVLPQIWRTTSLPNRLSGPGAMPTWCALTSTARSAWTRASMSLRISAGQVRPLPSGQLSNQKVVSFWSCSQVILCIMLQAGVECSIQVLILISVSCS